MEKEKGKFFSNGDDYAKISKVTKGMNMELLYKNMNICERIK